jgi:hypothetical protein
MICASNERCVMKGVRREYCWVEMLDVKKAPLLAVSKVDKSVFLLDKLQLQGEYC